RFAWFLAGQSLFFLYVSGLLRWLYRRGTIRDSAVNFAPIAALFYRFKTMFYRQSLALFRLAASFIKKVQPRIINWFQAAGQWLLRTAADLANRQKRIGEK
ncbi:MAG: PepSY domain-containing protein, partial [Methylovulum sp.]